MRPNMLGFLAIGLGLIFVTTPMLAHHSFMVQYDMNKLFMVKGVVTNVKWENPHISFYIDVTDEGGKVTTWGFDAAAPAALIRRGLTKTSLRPGDVVSVEGFLARSGKPFGAASVLTFSDDRRVFVGSDGVFFK